MTLSASLGAELALSFTSGGSTASALAGDVPSLARWGHALLGGHILHPASLRQVTRFRPMTPSGPGTYWDGYGLGLAQLTINGRRMWGHSGDGLGTHTEFWHLP